MSRVRRLLLFVGNPRSGTTLVRSLIDAHPQVMLGHEVDALAWMRHGETWMTVLGRIAESAQAFRRAPRWEGYDYRIDGSDGLRPPPVVIGDKKAAATARALLDDPLLVDRLLEWSPVPITVVHCVRHPMDVIATRSRRNHRPLAWNAERYFEHEQVAADLSERLGAQTVTRVYLETLIAAPATSLRSLLDAIQLDAPAGYLRACERRCFAEPSRSRQHVDWDAEVLTAIAGGIERCEHLWPYASTSAPS